MNTFRHVLGTELLHISSQQQALAHIQSLNYVPTIDFLASTDGARFLQEVIDSYLELRELIPDHSLFERSTMLREAAFSWTVIRRILVEFCDFEEALTGQMVAEIAHAFELYTPFNPRR